MGIELVESNESFRLVRLSERLDTAGIDAVEAHFKAAAVDPGVDAVVDLSRVTFLASLGVRMLVTGAKSLASRRRTMVLVNPQGVVAEFLEGAALDRLIPIVDSEEEALGLLNAAEERPA